MVAKGHKITNVSLFKKICDNGFFVTIILSYFKGLFEGAKTFLTP